MSGHHPFRELTKDFTPERRNRIDAIKGELKASMAVLLKFRDAFPDLYAEGKSASTIAFGSCGYKGATIYFRKSKVGSNQARIHSAWLRNFPNADHLSEYMKQNDVPVDPSKSHPDFLIGPEHADDVIAILRDGIG